MTTDLRRTTGGLGRGLASLIPTAVEEHPHDIPVRLIARNPYQPRGRFDEEEMARLAASVAEHGVLQPVIVTPVPEGYQLIAGERRVRAAEMVGLERVPAVIRSADQQEQLALALVENLQRTDLNAMDEARAFRRLADEFDLTQAEIAIRVGRSRPSITNTLRLLDASPSVQAAVADGHITEGHARAMAGVETHAAQDELLAVVIDRGLSVRRTEALARRARQPRGRGRAVVPDQGRDPDVDRLEAALRGTLATKVTISPAGAGGRIVIEYYDGDDLTRVFERITGTDR